MSDIIDRANNVAEDERKRTLDNAKLKAAQFEAGQPGDCDGCGNHFDRVVKREDGFFCGGCRDKLKLG